MRRRRGALGSIRYTDVALARTTAAELVTKAPPRLELASYFLDRVGSAKQPAVKAVTLTIIETHAIMRHLLRSFMLIASVARCNMITAQAQTCGREVVSTKVGQACGDCAQQPKLDLRHEFRAAVRLQGGSAKLCLMTCRESDP